MEFRDALKMLRKEIGVAQTDIAIALHINIATVARWEQGKTVPSRSFAMALLEYAKSKSATSESIDTLEKALNQAAKVKLLNSKSSLFSVEHDTISRLIEDVAFPIYACDLETDEILYVNHVTERQLGKGLDELVGKKCYECIMGRDKPCEFCHKNQLTEDSFTDYDAFRHADGKCYRVFGRLVKWNARSAQVRYAIEIDDSVQVATREELRRNYEKQIALRQQYAGDALAVAYYNLTRGTVTQVECKDAAIAARLVTGRYEDVIHALSENTFSAEERIKFDSIRDRDSLIKLFFQGKTQISIKHRIKGRPGYYEGTFALMQNPVTYDVEAFATLREITDEANSDTVVQTIR